MNFSFGVLTSLDVNDNMDINIHFVRFCWLEKVIYSLLTTLTFKIPVNHVNRPQVLNVVTQTSDVVIVYFQNDVTGLMQ